MLIIYQTKISPTNKIDTITIVDNDTCEFYKMSFNPLLGYYNDAQTHNRTKKDSKDY